MKRPGQNKPFFLNEKAVAVFGLAVLVMIAVPLYRGINQKRKINREIKQLEAEIKETENKNKQLKEMIDYFSSSQFLEEQARLNFKMKKPGEETVVVKTANPAVGGTEANGPAVGGGESERTVRSGNAGRWLKYFFK